MCIAMWTQFIPRLLINVELATFVWQEVTSLVEKSLESTLYVWEILLARVTRSDSNMQGGYETSAKVVLLVAPWPQPWRTMTLYPTHALPSPHVAPQKKEHANLQCLLTLAGTSKEAAGEYVSQWGNKAKYLTRICRAHKSDWTIDKSSFNLYNRPP